MKTIKSQIAVIALALAASCCHAVTNTNFVLVAKTVTVNSNGVLSAPSNFFSTNHVALSSWVSNTFVFRAGDSMTGKLGVPTLTVTNLHTYVFGPGLNVFYFWYATNTLINNLNLTNGPGDNGGTGDGVGDELFVTDPDTGAFKNYYLDASKIWRTSGGTITTDTISSATFNYYKNNTAADLTVPVPSNADWLGPDLQSIYTLSGPQMYSMVMFKAQYDNYTLARRIYVGDGIQSSRTNGNYYISLSNSISGLTLAATNFSVAFGTNSISFDHRGIVINSTTGRTGNLGYTLDTGGTGTLRFVNGLLVSPP